MVEGIGRGEDQALDHFGLLGGQDLGDSTSGVIADDHGPFGPERSDQVGDPAGLSGGAAVGVLVERQPMRTERKVGHHAAVARVGDGGPDLIPEPAVHEEAVDEYDQRSIAAGIPDLDCSAGEVDRACREVFHERLLSLVYTFRSIIQTVCM